MNLHKIMFGRLRGGFLIVPFVTPYAGAAIGSAAVTLTPAATLAYASIATGLVWFFEAVKSKPALEQVRYLNDFNSSIDLMDPNIREFVRTTANSYFNTEAFGNVVSNGLEFVGTRALEYGTTTGAQMALSYFATPFAGPYLALPAFGKTLSPLLPPVFSNELFVGFVKNLGLSIAKKGGSEMLRYLFDRTVVHASQSLKRRNDALGFLKDIVQNQNTDLLALEQSIQRNDPLAIQFIENLGSLPPQPGLTPQPAFPLTPPVPEILPMSQFVPQAPLLPSSPLPIILRPQQQPQQPTQQPTQQLSRLSRPEFYNIESSSEEEANKEARPQPLPQFVYAPGPIKKRRTSPKKSIIKLAKIALKKAKSAVRKSPYRQKQIERSVINVEKRVRKLSAVKYVKKEASKVIKRARSVIKSPSRKMAKRVISPARRVVSKTIQEIKHRR